MSVYFDPSVLIALYLSEPLSAKARALVEQEARPILVNQLQEVEFKNGIRQKVFRGEIEESHAVRCLRIFDDDWVEGKVQRKPLYWDAVYEKAEDISHRLALRQHCRAFDLLHVAVAVLSGVKRFATFDVEQRRVAAASGLDVATFAGG